MFQNSICSYPERGPFGDNKYRGNCSGFIIKDFLETYMQPDGLFVDPSVGGGTSMDVAKALGVKFWGSDLHQGYNLLAHDLKTAVGAEASAVFWHPPYWDIEYSGNMWDQKPHPSDMSRMELHEFTLALRLALMNIHDATAPGGHYGILMGNLRRKGRYFNLSSLVERLAPGRLVDEIIKVQWNCQSDNQQYRGRVVRIAHEKLLVFRKERLSDGELAATQRKAQHMLSDTLKATVARLLQRQPMAEAELMSVLSTLAPVSERMAALVREYLQSGSFECANGVYRCL